MEEYIMEQLKQLEEIREDLNTKIVSLARKEEALKNELQEIAQDHDMDLEVFSPRFLNEELKTKMKEIKLQIEELQLQQLRTQSEIETCTEKIEKFHEILLKARNEEQKINILQQKLSSEIKADDADQKSTENNRTEENKAEKNAAETDQDPDMRDKMETVLHRVEKCLNLIHTDKIKCKNELKQLRYYLRAVISEYDNK